MNVEQLQGFATRLKLIQRELKNLEDSVVQTVYESESKYYGTLLDEDVSAINYQANKIKEHLVFIEEFLQQEAVENVEAQRLIAQIKDEVHQEQVQFSKTFKEEI